MKILFIGSRLFDDVSWFLKNEDITSIITESNPNASNLELASKYYIVDRGMQQPLDIALKEDVDAVIPLIGIDPPLADVGKLKDTLESDYGIPTIASNFKTAKLCSDKFETKTLFRQNNIKTPEFKKLEKPYDIESIKEDLPIVLKTPDGQAGRGVKIAVSGDDIKEFTNTKDNIFTEEYIEGFEVSIEVLRWKNKSVALNPIYKGTTQIDGTHPLDKIKKAPLSIEGLDNTQHNLDLQNLAIKIGKLVDFESTMDIDILHDKNKNNDFIIELNTRPSGTRYMTAASSNIYPLCELVKMAKGNWNNKEVRKDIKNYCATELPIGDFNKSNNNEKFFKSENSYVVHGPEHYQRITIRSESMPQLNNMVYDLVNDYATKNQLKFT